MKPTNKKAKVTSLPSADELRKALQASFDTPARSALAALFDENTFVETSVYTKRSFHEFVSVDRDSEFEGVITGYGSIDGHLVFAFAQDETRMKGAIDAVHAKKIADLYELALRKEAPVIGIFASSGAIVEDGVTVLSAYGKLLKTVTDASRVIVQVAYILGNCTGTAAALASSFDFVVENSKSSFYLTNPELGGTLLDSDSISYRGDAQGCVAHIRSLLSFLPEGRWECVNPEPTDDINRRLGNLKLTGDPHKLLTEISDNGIYIENASNYGVSVVTAFATIAGVKCGIVANTYTENNGRITKDSAYKIADFLHICDSLSLPVVNLVDSDGLDRTICVDAVKELAYSYAQLSVPMVSVICGRAIGAAFTLLGSKYLGADLVYALDSAEIGVLPADAAVAFSWNDQISADVTREELEAKWRSTLSSAVSAASTGEIDDIISISELRARIASALLMLTH